MIFRFIGLGTTMDSQVFNSKMIYYRQPHMSIVDEQDAQANDPQKGYPVASI